MSFRNNTFAKIVTLIILLLIPIIFLYSLSIQTSMQVIRKEVLSLKQKDINFLANEIDRSITTLTSLGFLLSEDIHIQKMQTLHLIESAYEYNDERLRIMERLRLLNVSQRWDTQYSISSPSNQQFVSTNRHLSYDLDYLKERFAPNWKYQEVITQNIAQQRFVRHIVKPRSKIDELDQAGIILEISFPDEHIVRDLDTFKEAGKGDPFLYDGMNTIITNQTANTEIIHAINQYTQNNMLTLSNNSAIVQINNSDYLISFSHINTIDWYLVDYVPMENMLQPIIKTQLLFYITVFLLLLMSVMAGYLLYRNVQRPIGLLIRNVKKLQEGNYSTRIKVNPKNEFSYLFERFNDMAAETESLIKKVYLEEIRRREADVKQLQSQINPHFLYNCFALIRSMARLDKKESVMMLSLHLAKYYRYTTRVEKLTATLSDELKLLESYLEIQRFHIQHMNYRIDLPDSMLQLEIPRLLLQPIVENAVIHGIEQFNGDGLIEITGDTKEGWNSILIEDNGIGMSEEDLVKLKADIIATPNDNTGCALWNIRQRMIYEFGPDSILEFKLKAEGGVAVRLSWPAQSSINHEGVE